MNDDDLSLDDIAQFTWSFGQMFHLETDKGDFEWSDPDYGGDNTIRPTKPYGEWCELVGIDLGRSKGAHRIGDYCGSEVKFMQKVKP